ncbi:hypothetical protein [Agromyces humi]|uniref:hypothetical protein n=1 Tax=Agromyces humi TaxID=1766800 RepID=UPI00135B9258|nr:hypothetical protein [Agromyces humi]
MSTSHFDDQFHEVLWRTVWPDSEFLSLECPQCGTMSKPMVPHGTFSPQAFCPNEECEAWTWDPIIDPDVIRGSAISN